MLDRFSVAWLFEQKSNTALAAAIILFIITFILRYGFNLWWPWGIAMSVVCGVYAVFNFDDSR